MAKRAKPLGLTSNNIEEMKALMEEGLNLSLELGIKKVIMERDS